MNKGLVIAIMLLISALAGMAALYQFYVKEIIKDLQEKTADREQIEKKLEDLETTFYKTKPEVIIKRWRQETQPWAEAVFQRTDFFELRDEPKPIQVPEGKIPKFFYVEEFPKLEDRLWDYVDEKQCRIPNGLNFNAPAPKSLTGKNPSAEEVETWMIDYEYGASIIRFVADSGASEIKSLAIWPSETILKGSAGTIERRRIGFDVFLKYEDLVTFLEKLRTSDRYFSVDVLKLTNRELLDPDAELNAQMIVTQTHFIKKIVTAAAGSSVPANAGSAKRPGAQARFRSMFPKRSIVPVEEESWWTRFRKNNLPF